MSAWVFFRISFVLIFVFSALYAPQPLLGVLSTEFGVSKGAAALLTTAVMLPMGFAPTIFGYLLESVSPKRMVFWAVSLLAVSEVASALALNYSMLLVIRVIQGFLIPASLTSLMTYLSGAARPEAVQRTMQLYICVTIVGGFFSRSFAGLMSSLYGWRVSLGIVAAALGVGLLFLGALKEPESGLRPTNKIKLSAAPDVLRRPGFLRVYLVIFCCFYVFASIMNVLPFRMAELIQGVSEARIGMMYFGHMVGVILALTATRLSKFLGGEIRAILLSVIVYLACAPIFLIPNQWAMFFAMFPFSFGLFLAHSVAPGFLNSLSDQNRGLINGLYVSFYYTGGALGSYFPGLIYAHWGWGAYVWSSMAVLGVALVLAPKKTPTP